MKNRGAVARSTTGKIAAVLLCGALFAAAPAFANPSYTFKTIAAVDPNGTLDAFAGLGVASINDAGVVAFYGATWCGGTNRCSFVYTVDPAGTVTKLIQGTPIGTFPYQLHSEAVINSGGAVSFNVQNFTASNS